MVVVVVAARKQCCVTTEKRECGKRRNTSKCVGTGNGEV